MEVAVTLAPKYGISITFDVGTSSITLGDATPALVGTLYEVLRGEKGDPGDSTITLTAGTALSGHRAIRSVAGQAAYASSATAADGSLVLGISRGAADAGSPVVIQNAGEMIEPSWSWTPDLPIFCGPTGTLTQTPPATGFALVVAVAITATKIQIGLKMPVVLT